MLCGTCCLMALKATGCIFKCLYKGSTSECWCSTAQGPQERSHLLRLDSIVKSAALVPCSLSVKADSHHHPPADIPLGPRWTSAQVFAWKLDAFSWCAADFSCGFYKVCRVPLNVLVRCWCWQQRHSCWGFSRNALPLRQLPSLRFWVSHPIKRVLTGPALCICIHSRCHPLQKEA